MATKRPVMAAFYLLHTAIAVALGCALFRGRAALLQVVGFVLPLGGLVVWIGVNWSWSKVLPLILVAAAVLMPGRGRRLRTLPGAGWLALLATWALFVTLWARVVDPEITELLQAGWEIGWVGSQGEYRHLVQLIVEVSHWMVYVAGYCLATGRREADAAARGFVYGNVLSVLVGVYQALAQGMGLPWIERDNSRVLSGNLGVGAEHGGPIQLGTFAVARMYGLGGEPKHTAALLVMAIVLMLTRELRGERLRFHRLILAVLVGGLGLTWSTSGWVALVTAVVILVLSAVGQPGVAGSALLRLGRNLALVMVVFFGMYSQMESEERAGMVDARLTGRLSSLSKVAHYEPKDAAALAIFQAQPERLVVGTGVGGVDFHALRYVRRITLGPRHMVTPTYLATRTLAELGAPGLLLLVAVLVSLWRRGQESGAGVVVALAPLVLIQPMLTFPAFLFLAGTQLRRSARVRPGPGPASTSGASPEGG